jgi:glycosyltransferase involved in cell wall biosynthesis
MRVTLIIVTRNNARLLRSTLASLRRLTVKPDELILVDNASTDDTASICRAYRDDFPVKYVYEPKIGIPYVRNAGVAHAAHEIVVFNDDDYEVSATWLEELLLPFRYDPTVGCVGGKVEYSPAGSRLNRFYHEINSAVEDEWRDHT